MEATSSVNYNGVIIDDIEKMIDIKTIQRYLESTQMLSQLSKYTKHNNKIYLEFCESSAACKFIEENAFKAKIMAKTFNLYFTFMETIPENRVEKYEIIGITESKLRGMFDKYNKYGPSRCLISYHENGKLSHKCELHLLK